MTLTKIIFENHEIYPTEYLQIFSKIITITLLIRA
jgi:hypothetical protein